jgi:hypothetical protein
VQVEQAIFVYDANTGSLSLLAKTGTEPDREYDDFVYWNYSGAPPGAGEGDGEPPRFRSSAFLAISARPGAGTRTAFKARRGDLDGDYVYINVIDGIYLAEQVGSGPARLATLLETGMDGTVLDPDAVEGGLALPIAELALERDGFRGGKLAIAASMGEEEDGWGGIYLAQPAIR